MGTGRYEDGAAVLASNAGMQQLMCLFSARCPCSDEVFLRVILSDAADTMGNIHDEPTPDFEQNSHSRVSSQSC